jgi:dTDP-4-amino-4,6-dideoxygalactose transaminase
MESGMSQASPFDVPLCDLNSQYRQIESEVLAALSRVLSSGQSILGPEVSQFEKEIAEKLEARYAVGCSSGSDAISLALHALEIGPGDEVIMPPFTFFATAGCVVRAGATPIFADIDPNTYNLDPEQVESKITPRTKAIMPVHLYGQSADMEPLQMIADRHDLDIIEDAAQAYGAEYHGRKIGTLGAIGCFSFYPSKNLGTYGDAGLVTTDSEKLYNRLKTLRVHGMEPKYYHHMVGWNARIDALHAAILRVKLKYIDEWTLMRQEAARRYTQIIEGRGLQRWIQRPRAVPGLKHVYNQYVIRVSQTMRDDLADHLKKNRIGCEIYYPLCLHMQKCFENLGHKRGEFPVSEEAARSVLALPMYPEITLSQQERVVDTVTAYLTRQVRIAA